MIFRFRRPKREGPDLPKSELTDCETVVNLYRLFLGREPESVAVVEENLTNSLADNLRTIIGSGECCRNVLVPILTGIRPHGNLFDSPPGPTLAAWSAARLPLSDVSRDRVRRASASWIALYRSIFLDEVFDESFRFTGKPDRDEFVVAFERLAATSRVDGAIEEITPDAIRGWAADSEDPDRVLELQLFLDGALVSTARPDRFRRDVQDRFGGDGLAGFAFPLDLTNELAPDRIFEIRHAATGTMIGSGSLRSAPPAQVPLSWLRDEVAALRSSLDRIEAVLREEDATGAVPIFSYDTYAAHYFGPVGGSGPSMRSRHAGRGSGGAEVLPIAVEIDLAELDPRLASLKADSVLASRRQPEEILFLTARNGVSDGALTDDIVRRAGWSSPVPVRWLSVDGGAAERWRAALQAVTSPHALLLMGARVLSADGLGTLGAALAAAPGSALLYGDDDAVDASGRRVAPVLRSAFDPDLLLQIPFIDGAVLVDTNAVLALGTLAINAGPSTVSALALALHGAGATLTHVARILSTSLRAGEPRGDDCDVWRSVVEAFLASQGEAGWEIRPHCDPFATVSGALDIRYPSRIDGARATVIIPTRDQPNLLREALDSVEASRSTNRTAMEIVIVDNGSVESETFAVLTQAAERGAQVIRYDGPFNWALMNNMAADRVSSDVLVFLNDDMRIIAPDWLDRLCELALRPDVGAVGTRLHYADGTIQHAGILVRGPDANPIHEGVGADADDPGYLNRNSLVRRVLAVTGACLATRRSVFCESGGFDSGRYPVECNDIDYCLKLNDQGLKVLYTPYACLYHLESMSRRFSRDGEKRMQSEYAMRVLSERWGQRFPSDPYFNAHFDRLRRPFAYLRSPPPLIVH